MRPNILPLPPEPKDSHKYRQTPSDQASIIHIRRIKRQREREAEYHNKSYDIKTRYPIDDKSRCSFHPEPAGGDVRSPAEEMREDCGEVGERGQHDERADEGVECCLASDVDAAEERADDSTENDRVEWIALLAIDAAEESTEWGRVVSG